MVAQLRDAANWRREGCSEGCSLRMVIIPGLLGRQSIEVHDPDTHEMYGRALTGDVAGQSVLESGPLVLWRRELRLWVEGREISLTPTEWRIVLAIIDGNGRAVPSAQVLSQCWGTAFLDDVHLLRVNLARIRGRLGEAAGLIQTVRGIGYRFHFITPGERALASKAVYATLIDRGRWSVKHAACRVCAKTTSPHRSHGYCQACYSRLNRLGRFDNVPDGAL